MSKEGLSRGESGHWLWHSQGLAGSPYWISADRSHGVRDFVFLGGEVDELLWTSYKLRELGQDVADNSLRDVTIQIAREFDDLVLVFLAVAT